MQIEKEALAPRSSTLRMVESVIAEIHPDRAELAEWFRGYAAGHAARFALDFEMLQASVPIESSVLEFGSVPPILTGALKKAGYRVTGIDIAPERFESAIVRLGLEVRKRDIEREPLPFETSSFDTVIFNELFEHLRIDLIFTMREVLRVLKPGGMMLLSTPNFRSWNGIMNFVVRNRGYSCDGEVFLQYEKLEKLGHMGHVREYTSYEVTDFLEKVGFDVEKLTFRGMHGSWLPQLIMRLVPTLRPFMTVTARKPPQQKGVSQECRSPRAPLPQRQRGVMCGNAKANLPPQLRDVAFPLNVYARALELEEGRAEALHYGLYETPDVPTPAAQRCSTELLWRHLPPPCRLLEVGIGFGATLARLVGAGYAATGITPDAAQVACARARHGAGLPAVCVRLEDFADEPGSWDGLLFQESAQYIDPLDLFTQADRLLTGRGEILIVDEFALRRTAPGHENLHLLPHFVALAGRFGFAVVEQLDLSRRAAPTLDYLLRVVPRHAEALRRDLDVSMETLDALTAAHHLNRQKFADGRYGYFLIKLRRLSRPRWRIGRIDADSAGAMRALFAEIFGHPMSDARWRWKYGEGRGAAVGVWEEERLVAHYGGVARSIMFFGEAHSAAQSCDVMVAPAGRGTLSRQGPLFLAAATYLENQLGYGNPHLLGVGFPNVRAWKAPARLGLYGGPVGRMLELSWPTARGWPSPKFALRPLDLTGPADRADAEACWLAMRAELNNMIVGVRDAEALHRRYTAHPDIMYRVFIVRVRLTRRPLGLFVLRPGGEEGCELMDVVGPCAAIPRLVAQARRAAARSGAERLFGWVVDNIVPCFGAGAAVRDLEVFVPANAWTAGPPIEKLIGKWWLTGGDTDFR
jgi:SAM-dependent methyltransferase